MKKLLLISTAIAGVAMLSAPASAALKMDMGGFFRGYGVFTDNNEVGGAGANLREFDFRRDNELHFNGETTLDNGLTVGAHTELKLSGPTSLTDGSTPSVDESYAYFSGGWGRFNFGQEDGAAYLLQVAAPSADSNVDGMRVFIQALSKRRTQAAGEANAQNAGWWTFDRLALDYQQADHRQVDRLTYLTPKYNGFQAGVSYAPHSGVNGVGTSLLAPTADDNSLNTVNDLWEVAARWDGEYQGFGISFGGGYSSDSLESTPTKAGNFDALTNQQYNIIDGLDSWNAGLSVAYNGFTLGGGFTRNETSRETQTIVATDLAANLAIGDITRDTWVVGLTYDNGPYHVGGSYLDQETNYDALAVAANANNIAARKYRDDKFTIGAGYTFGPGMTFRGSVAWGNFKAPAADTAGNACGVGISCNNRFTQAAIGTDIQF